MQKQTPDDFVQKYMPALKWNWLSRYYDGICSISGFGNEFKGKILQAIPLRGDETLLDIGCGSGVFISLAQKRFPNCRIIGIDPDEDMLSNIEHQLEKEDHHVELIHGFAEQLPLPDNSVDICYATLMFHHLLGEQKKKAIKEIHRVLKPDGSVIVADFKKITLPSIAHFFPFEHYPSLRENFEGVLDRFFTEENFQENGIIDESLSVINIKIFTKTSSVETTR